MYEYLLIGCFLQLGFCSDKCSKAVLGRREMLYVPEGGSLKLSCVVQHCDTDSTWEGKWKWEKLPNSSSGTVEESAKHRLTSVKLTANKTKLVLLILSVSQSDGASYQCGVTWDDNSSEVGHWMDVNVTKVSVQRNVLHRVFICAGAFLCLPVFLGLACCLRSKVKPQPHPRIEVTYAAVQRHRSHLHSQPPPQHPVPKKCTSLTHKASTNSQKKIELVYADISQDALRQQEAIREPVESTVYSSVKFS